MANNSAVKMFASFCIGFFNNYMVTKKKYGGFFPFPVSKGGGNLGVGVVLINNVEVIVVFVTF